MFFSLIHLRYNKDYRFAHWMYVRCISFERLYVLSPSDYGNVMMGCPSTSQFGSTPSPGEVGTCILPPSIVLLSPMLPVDTVL